MLSVVMLNIFMLTVEAPLIFVKDMFSNIFLGKQPGANVINF
jgi:hypothetical protein